MEGNSSQPPQELENVAGTHPTKPNVKCYKKKKKNHSSANLFQKKKHCLESYTGMKLSHCESHMQQKIYMHLKDAS